MLPVRKNSPLPPFKQNFKPKVFSYQDWSSFLSRCFANDIRPYCSKPNGTLFAWHETVFKLFANVDFEKGTRKQLSEFIDYKFTEGDSPYEFLDNLIVMSPKFIIRTFSVSSIPKLKRLFQPIVLLSHLRSFHCTTTSDIAKYIDAYVPEITSLSTVYTKMP